MRQQVQSPRLPCRRDHHPRMQLVPWDVIKKEQSVVYRTERTNYMIQSKEKRREEERRGEERREEKRREEKPLQWDTRKGREGKGRDCFCGLRVERVNQPEPRIPPPHPRIHRSPEPPSHHRQDAPEAKHGKTKHGTARHGTLSAGREGLLS